MIIPYFLNPFGLTVADYIKNGLLQHYDAINNTGNGHNNAAITWADLIGNNNGAILGTAVWEDNSLVFDGVYNKVVFVGNITPTYTITVTILPTLSGSYPRIFGENTYPTLYMNSASSFRFSMYGHGVDTAFLPYTYPSVTQKNQLTLTFANNQIKLYINGEFKATVSASVNAASMITAYLGGRSANDRQYAGRIYNYMVYDRALSDAEILHNFEIDKKRFGI